MTDTYGDVTAEYMAIRNEAAVVDIGRSLLWVTGPDAVEYLDGILSQDIAAMVAGSVARSLLLAPQGKLRALLWLLRGESEVGIVADAGGVSAARTDLERFRLRVAATIGEPAPLIEVWGPMSAEVVKAALGADPQGWWRSGTKTVVRAPVGGLDRYFISGVPTESLIEAGALPAGNLAVTAVRIEVGEPIMGVDVDESTIPQEAHLTADSVSFTKGCYLGQELVARIDSRGRVNRFLRGLAIERNLIPPVGASITVDGGEVGSVTSVGESLELRSPIAMGMVRHEVSPGQPVELRWDGGSVDATVEELPLDDFAMG